MKYDVTVEVRETWRVEAEDPQDAQDRVHALFDGASVGAEFIDCLGDDLQGIVSVEDVEEE